MEKSITNPFLLQDETVRPAQMELPEELRKKVVILQCESEEGICKVYLVGTTHYSSQSCEDVEAIIGFLKPDLVFLELCETRAHRSKPRDPRPTVVPRFIDVMVAMWKSNDYNAFATLVSFLMKNIEDYSDVFLFLSSKLDTKKQRNMVVRSYWVIDLLR
ncbi:hypothetical protein SUGI_0343760 [Cryptomeria japonica]|nr:hypothetical protein SUGI_0343760 [Cryptomeria japonica]